jgi:lysophospholipase L1-like esterase
MDLSAYLKKEGELPLDQIVQNGGFCGILRRIVCVGDSLSSGEMEGLMDGEKIFHDMYEFSWGQFLARDAGTTVYNCSKGGMTAKAYIEGFADERGFFDEKYAAPAYIIALGVNDMARVIDGEMEYGSLADVHTDEPEKNPHTFVGSYAAIISRYKKMVPKAKFFLFTMPSHHMDDDLGRYYDKHQKTMYELAEIFENCYVLDFRKYAPDFNAEFKKTFYLAGHMNAAGYRLVALMVESYIDYIIRHNADDFRQIAFVGTPYHHEGEKW